MGESLITISIVGFLAGFVLSMPIAGPVSIFITSNALKGNRRYCYLVAVGASLVDFIYVFIAVFCLTKLYSYYKPFIPYLLSGGSVFLFYIGVKIFKTKIEIKKIENPEQSETRQALSLQKINEEKHGGFYAGFMMNILNPALLLGWLTSSFIVITFVSSLGFKTGGLDTMIERNEKKINNIKGEAEEIHQMPSYLRFENKKENNAAARNPETITYPKNFPLYISLCYSLFLALGGITWFYLLSLFLVSIYQRINGRILNLVISGLGITLCGIGLFFGYTAVRMFL